MTDTQPQVEWRGPDTPRDMVPEEGRAGEALQVPERPLPWPGKIGLWLLWLSVALPASAVVFLGLPGFAGLAALAFLEQGGVRPEELAGPWLTPGPWLALGLVGVGVNAYASVYHRRPKRRTDSGRRVWLILGAVFNLAAVGAVWLETAPQTDLHPVVHYAAVSLSLAWWVLTLAYGTGRIVSVFTAPVERWAIRSDGVRGALTATGPMSVVAVVAVVGTNVGHELVEGELGAPRGLTSGLGDTPLGRQLALGAGPPSPGDKPEDFNACIEALYGPPNPSQFRHMADYVDRSYRGLDGEHAAAETALKVCFKGGRSGVVLERYYKKSVRNRANTMWKRGKRSNFDSCDFSWGPGVPEPELELTDCLNRQLCRLSDADQEALRLHLLDYGADEISERLAVSKSAAQKRVQRSKARFETLARERCAD